MSAYTYTLEQFLFVVVGSCVDTPLVLGRYLNFGLKTRTIELHYGTHSITKYFSGFVLK